MTKTQNKHSSGIVENSLVNGLELNLKNAIEKVGVNISNSECLWQYPEIIKNNLITKNYSGTIPNTYDVIDSDTIDFNIDNEKNILTANIECITFEEIEELLK